MRRSRDVDHRDRLDHGDPVNDVPEASPTSVSLDEDAPLTIDFDALVADVETADGDLLSTS